MDDATKLRTFLLDDTVYVTRSTPKFDRRKPYVPGNPNNIDAFIPGVIQKLYVAAGQAVRWGERLVVLEAMKMKNDITSPRDGIVKAIHVGVGEMVAKGQLLVELE